MTRVAVVGAGSWGTAFASIPADNGIETVVWARREELAEAISSRRENVEYLPGVELPATLAATHDMQRAVAGSDVVVMAIPSHAYREVFREVLPHLAREASVISLTKGVEQGTLLRMTEVMREEGDVGDDRLGVVSGPNLAKEIASRRPAASVVACSDDRRCEELQAIFMAPHFRVFTNRDVVGVELGGAIKNVIAIAAGIAEGMGFGDNAKASLITRGLAELARLGASMGGNPLTFAGLAGMGDLVATCYSPLSRNRHVGEQLGRGRKLDEIVAEMKMVAEGVKTSRAVVDLAARVGVEVPISEHVARVVRGDLTIEEMATSLLSREIRSELEGIEDAR
jgi:glycerol-3-phosphate dehydrogenase (NAD(P)+)